MPARTRSVHWMMFFASSILESIQKLKRGTQHTDPRRRRRSAAAAAVETAMEKKGNLTKRFLSSIMERTFFFFFFFFLQLFSSSPFGRKFKYRGHSFPPLGWWRTLYSYITHVWTVLQRRHRCWYLHLLASLFFFFFFFKPPAVVGWWFTICRMMLNNSPRLQNGLLFRFLLSPSSSSSWCTVFQSPTGDKSFPKQFFGFFSSSSQVVFQKRRGGERERWSRGMERRISPIAPAKISRRYIYIYFV